MRRNSLAYVVLLLAVAAPGLGQSEDEPYFSLRSSRTFGSNGAPDVALSATNVDTLDFRVYRVNDPVTVLPATGRPARVRRTRTAPAA